MLDSKTDRGRRGGLLRNAGLAFAGAVMLAGCQTSQYPEIQQTGSLRAFRTTDRHPIVVEQGQAQLRIELPGASRGLTPRQSAQVRAFLDDYKSLGDGELVVTVPSGTANEAAAVAAANDVRSIMSAEKIAKTAVRYVPYRGGAHAEPPMQIAFERYFANPSACGHWPRNLAHEPYNKPWANFGCAAQNNLAAMVADPRDLVRSRELGPGDAERRFEVLEQYRKGRTTSAKRTADESAEVSEVE